MNEKLKLFYAIMIVKLLSSACMIIGILTNDIIWCLLAIWMILLNNMSHN